MPIAVYDRGLMKRKLMETMTSDVAEATIISSLMAQWYGAATPVISYPISYDL
jgi:hypothetical protein